MALVLVHTMILSDIVWADPDLNTIKSTLARWTAMQDSRVVESMAAQMLRRGLLHIAEPGTDIHERLTEPGAPQGLKLPSGCIAVTQETAESDSILAQAIRNAVKIAISESDIKPFRLYQSHITELSESDFDNLKLNILLVAYDIYRTLRDGLPEGERKYHNYDLNKALSSAKKINPKFKFHYSEDKAKLADPRMIEDFIDACSIQIFIPSNRMPLRLYHTGDENFPIELAGRFKILEDTWKKEEYLGTYIWQADIESTDDRFAITTDSIYNYVFINPRLARELASENYSWLMGERGIILTSPTSLWLSNLCRESSIDETTYVESCSLEFLRRRELRYAKDALFADLLYDEPIEALNEIKRAEAILKPSSSFYQIINEQPEESFERRLFSLRALCLSSMLGGLIDAMRFHIKEGRHDLAYAVFLDFANLAWPATGVISIKGSHPLLKSDVELAMRKYYAEDLLLSKGIDSEKALLKYVESDTGKPALKALALVKELYESQFYTDEERAKILEEKNRPDYPEGTLGTAKAFDSTDRQSRRPVKPLHLLEKIRIIEEVYAKLFNENPHMREKIFKRGEKGVYLPSDIGSVAKILKVALSGRDGQRFLDFGSFDGRVVMLAALFGMKADGIEFDEEAIEFAKKAQEILEERGIIEKGLVNFTCGDAYTADFGLYDVIYLFDGDGIDAERFQNAVNERAKKEVLVIVNHPKSRFDKFRALLWPRLLHPRLLGRYEGKAMVYRPQAGVPKDEGREARGEKGAVPRSAQEADLIGPSTTDKERGASPLAILVGLGAGAVLTHFARFSIIWPLAIVGGIALAIFAGRKILAEWHAAQVGEIEEESSSITSERGKIDRRLVLSGAVFGLGVYLAWPIVRSLWSKREEGEIVIDDLLKVDKARHAATLGAAEFFDIALDEAHEFKQGDRIDIKFKSPQPTPEEIRIKFKMGVDAEPMKIGEFDTNFPLVTNVHSIVRYDSVDYRIFGPDVFTFVVKETARPVRQLHFVTPFGAIIDSIIIRHPKAANRGIVLPAAIAAPATLGGTSRIMNRDEKIAILKSVYGVRDGERRNSWRPTTNGQSTPYSIKNMVYIMDIVGIDSSKTFVDIGSGDGRMVFLGDIMGLDATGIEIDPRFKAEVEAKRRELIERGVPEAAKAKFIYRDVRDKKVSLSGYDIYYHYQPMSDNDEILEREISEKIARSAADGSIIINKHIGNPLAHERFKDLNLRWLPERVRVSVVGPISGDEAEEAIFDKVFFGLPPQYRKLSISELAGDGLVRRFAALEAEKRLAGSEQTVESQQGKILVQEAISTVSVFALAVGFSLLCFAAPDKYLAFLFAAAVIALMAYGMMTIKKRDKPEEKSLQPIPKPKRTPLSIKPLIRAAIKIALPLAVVLILNHFIVNFIFLHADKIEVIVNRPEYTDMARDLYSQYGQDMFNLSRAKLVYEMSEFDLFSPSPSLHYIDNVDAYRNLIKNIALNMSSLSLISFAYYKLTNFAKKQNIWDAFFKKSPGKYLVKWTLKAIDVAVVFIIYGIALNMMDVLNYNAVLNYLGFYSLGDYFLMWGNFILKCFSMPFILIFAFTGMLSASSYSKLLRKWLITRVSATKAGDDIFKGETPNVEAAPGEKHARAVEVVMAQPVEFAVPIEIKKPRDTKPANETFGRLNKAVRENPELNSPVSTLNGTCQRPIEASKLRLCVPVDVFKNSADLTHILEGLSAVRKIVNNPNNPFQGIPFELVITGVKEKKDISAIINLNNDGVIKQALMLTDNFSVSYLTEEEMKQEAAGYPELEYDLSKSVDKARFMRDRYLGRAGEGEYVAVITDAVPEDESEIFKNNLKPGSKDNVSIFVLTYDKSKDLNGRRVYALSKIISTWLENIKQNKTSILMTIEAVKPYSEELDTILKAAWELLTKA